MAAYISVPRDLRPKVRPYKTCNYYSILTKEVTFRDESSEKDR